MLLIFTGSVLCLPQTCLLHSPIISPFNPTRIFPLHFLFFCVQFLQSSFVGRHHRNIYFFFFFSQWKLFGRTHLPYLKAFSRCTATYWRHEHREEREGQRREQSAPRDFISSADTEPAPTDPQTPPHTLNSPPFILKVLTTSYKVP